MSDVWTNDGVPTDARRLFDAMVSNHRQGLPWTHPETGRTFLAPKAYRKVSKRKNSKRGRR
jgi:hypothetical protein